jgi:integrase
MGRRRKHERHLPRRIYQRAGTFYYVDPADGRWINLGRDYGIALTTYGKLVTTSVAPAARTMSDLIDRYMTEVAPTKAKATFRDNQRQAKLLRAVFGRLKPAEITSRHVYQYMDQRAKKSEVQANRELALLSVIFSKAIRWGDVAQSPCRNIERFKEQPRNRYVSDQEFWAFRDFAPELIGAYMEFQYLTALRQGDILAMRLDQLKEDGVVVKVSKSGKPIMFEWTDALHQSVKRIKGLARPIRGLHLFCTRRGRAYSSSGFRSIWQRHMRAAIQKGVLTARFTTHDIRAKTATDAGNVERASELLGHSDKRVTERHYMRLPRRVQPLK